MVSATGCQGGLYVDCGLPCARCWASQSQFSGAISINMTSVDLRAIICAVCGAMVLTKT